MYLFGGMAVRHFVSIFILAWLMAFTASTYAESNLCNAGIKPIKHGETSYKMRGDRCEGLFLQKVSTTGIRIVGFHNNPINFETDALTMNIISSDKDSVKNLTVSSLENNKYYRMDTIYADKDFSLSLDIIKHPEINLKPIDLAALICKQDCSNLIPTFIPASFSKGVKIRPYAILMANLELLQLNILIKDQASGAILYDEEITGGLSWPASKPITVPLKTYLQDRKEILFEVIAVGLGGNSIDNSGHKPLDSISVRLQSK